jgi:enoyl-[acyl-carrier-protein] reductase (NADH)
MTADVPTPPMTATNDETDPRLDRGASRTGTAVYLASHASDVVTGATNCVDGGYSTR